MMSPWSFTLPAECSEVLFLLHLPVTEISDAASALQLTALEHTPLSLMVEAPTASAFIVSISAERTLMEEAPATDRLSVLPFTSGMFTSEAPLACTFKFFD